MTPVFPWLHWLHHASFRIESAGKVIYLDPWKVKQPVPADYIFVTHAHGDHFSLDDIKKISKPGALILGPSRVVSKLAGAEVNVRELKVGESFTLEGLSGRAVASYNCRKPMHPKKHGNTGFILDLAEGRVYHAGDTDFIPEMADFQGVTLALLPVGKTFFFRPTMGPEQAAQAVEAMRPQFAAPMHYGLLPGSKKDGALFKNIVGDRAVILSREE